LEEKLPTEEKPTQRGRSNMSIGVVRARGRLKELGSKAVSADFNERSALYVQDLPASEPRLRIYSPWKRAYALSHPAALRKISPSP
jgi:hypothetical protein